MPDLSRKRTSNGVRCMQSIQNGMKWDIDWGYNFLYITTQCMVHDPDSSETMNIYRCFSVYRRSCIFLLLLDVIIHAQTHTHCWGEPTWNGSSQHSTLGLRFVLIRTDSVCARVNVSSLLAVPQKTAPGGVGAVYELTTNNKLATDHKCSSSPIHQDVHQCRRRPHLVAVPLANSCLCWNSILYAMRCTEMTALDNFKHSWYYKPSSNASANDTEAVPEPVISFWIY